MDFDGECIDNFWLFSFPTTKLFLIFVVLNLFFLESRLEFYYWIYFDESYCNELFKFKLLFKSMNLNLYSMLLLSFYELASSFKIYSESNLLFVTFFLIIWDVLNYLFNYWELDI